jgi:hypothetical protein
MPSRDKKPSQMKDDSQKSELVRRFKANPFLFCGTVLVLVIIVIAFVFVPAIVPEAMGGGDLVFGYYNRTPVKYMPGNHFHQVWQFLMQRHQPAHDDPNFMQTIAQIWRVAFEEAAIRIGILDTMKQAGFIVPEDIISREMAELPQFQENGRFSLARYRAMDNAARMTLWQQVHENYIIEHFLMDLASIQTPSAEVSFVSSMGSPQRSFNLAIFPFASFPSSEMRSFAEVNPDFFKPVQVSSISLPSEREARQILTSIRNGNISFEEAARNHSTDWAAGRSGEMGSFMAFELSWLVGNETARQNILNLAAGELTDVHRIEGLNRAQDLWTFYRVDEAAFQVDLNDPNMESRIRSFFTENMRGRVEDWVMSEAERFSARAREIGFNAAAAAEAVVSHSFGPIPLNYGNSVLFPSISAAGIPELDEAGNDIIFWRAAFTTPLNTFSRPFVMGDNVIVLFPTEETTMDESDIGFIESFYPFWIGNNTENAHRAYFLSSERLDDRFNETFWRLWR